MTHAILLVPFQEYRYSPSLFPHVLRVTPRWHDPNSHAPIITNIPSVIHVLVLISSEGFWLLTVSVV